LANQKDLKMAPEKTGDSAYDITSYNNRLDVEYKLPITSSRTAKWYYSAFHNVTAIVGAGVLGLPHAMSYLGWPGGMVVLCLSWIISLYTLWQLVMMHEMNGRRFNRYQELGQYAFGPRGGLWVILPSQLIVMIGLGITYSVTGGQSLKFFYDIVCEKNALGQCTPFGLSAWIIVFSAVHFFLIQCPNFNSLAGVSLLAAIMSMGYSTIAFGGSLARGKQPGVAYNGDGRTLAQGLFGAFNALGTVAFAYGGHNVILEIQATIPSKPNKPTHVPMMQGVWLAYAVVSWCYFGVSIAGYWAFGNKVGSNVIFTIGTPEWMVAMASMFVVFHVIGSYQVYTMPVLDMIEVEMVKRGIPNGLPTRLVYRSLYVCFTCFVACTIPFFGDLMGFIGALGTGPTTFWIPSVLWLVLKKPAKSSWHFWASWVCIVLGVLVTIVGSIGGLRGIIVSASTYKFYQ
jgi:amino acid permease